MRELKRKIPLFLSMFGSSVLIGISTYNTFPSSDSILRYSVSIIGGMSFDIILVVTVFSDRKNFFSYATVLAAACIGLSIALDLYLIWGLVWLHALYIILSTCFALHLATTQDARSEQTQNKDQGLLQRLLRHASVSSQEGHRETEQTEAVSESSLPENDTQSGTQKQTEQYIKKHKYECVVCHKKLDTVQAENASKRYSYCKYCKGKNKKV